MNEMIDKDENEELTLFDLFTILWKRKKLIIGITVTGMILSLLIAVISIILPSDISFYPNLYTPKAQMLINDGETGNSLSAKINASGLGSLASLAGVNTGISATNSALAGYLIESITIQDAIINKFDLTTRYEIDDHPKTESRRALKQVLHSTFDMETGIFTISFEDWDPVFARDVVNYTVDLLENRFNELGIDKNKLTKQNLEDNIGTCYSNILSLQSQIQNLEKNVSNPYGGADISSVVMDSNMLKMELDVQEQLYANLKAQYETLKISMASEQPVFQILEYAEVPDEKSGPSRGLLCIIITLSAGCLSVCIVFILNAIEEIKKDPVRMSKLKGEEK